MCIRDRYCKLNKDIADNAFFGIQLSECLRTLVCLDLPYDGYPKYWHITPTQFMRGENGFKGWDLNVSHNKFIYDNRYALAPIYLNITHSVLTTINTIIGFVDFCKLNNYPFFIFDGLSKNIPEYVDNKWVLTNPRNEAESYEVLVSDNEDIYQFFYNEAKPIIHSKIIEYINSIPEYIQTNVCKYYLEMLGNAEIGDIEYYTKGNQGHPNKKGAELWAKYLKNKVKNLW
jgi:hypothetical protein